MEQSTDLQSLIQSFLGYRDMLVPVLSSLNEFVATYDSLREDIATLNATFNGDVGGQLQRIYQDLAQQAKRSADLSGQVDNFVRMGAGYQQQLQSLADSLSAMHDSMSTLTDIERKADEQLGKLDKLIEEKRKDYNLRDLQRALDNYNNNVQRVSDFINKDVAGTLADNNSRLDGIRSQSDSILKALGKESSDVGQLLNEVRNNNMLLTRLVEQQTVDEAYLYAVLDRLALSRHIKLKN